MIDWLVETNGGVVPLILRLTLAVVMFPHGAQKTLGWFGGFGFRGPLAYFTKAGFPRVLSFLALIAEFFGPLRLAVRPLPPIAAAGPPGVTVLAVLGSKQAGLFF